MILRDLLISEHRFFKHPFKTEYQKVNQSRFLGPAYNFVDLIGKAALVTQESIIASRFLLI